MATTNDDMQKSVKAAEAESAKASETRVTASETTAPVNSDARAVAEPTAPVSKDAPAVANTQDAQPNLNAEAVQAEVDAELEALFAEADADEIPDAAQEVLLAQADDSADDAPAEEGEGEGESADGSVAGDGAMGAGQIGLIGLGLAAAAAAGGSSSSNGGGTTTESGDITSETDNLPAVNDANEDVVYEVTSIPSDPINVDIQDANSVTFRFSGDAADGTVTLDGTSVLTGDIIVENGTLDVSDADVTGVTSFTANSAVNITASQLQALLDTNDEFTISSDSEEVSTFTLALNDDDDVAAYNELVSEGGLLVSGTGASTFDFAVSDAGYTGNDPDSAATAAAQDLSALIKGGDFTLTTSATDDLEGTENADTFNAAESTYLESSDSVDGKGGVDTLDAVVTGADGTGILNPSLTSVENVNYELLDGNSSNGDTTTLRFNNSSGVNTLSLDNYTNGGSGNIDTIEVEGLSKNDTFTITNDVATDANNNYTFSFLDAGNPDDAATVNLKSSVDATLGTVTVNGIEDVTVASTGAGGLDYALTAAAAETVNIDSTPNGGGTVTVTAASAETLNVTSPDSLTLVDADLTNVETFNVTSETADETVTMTGIDVDRGDVGEVVTTTLSGAGDVTLDFTTSSTLTSSETLKVDASALGGVVAYTTEGTATEDFTGSSQSDVVTLTSAAGDDDSFDFGEGDADKVAISVDESSSVSNIVYSGGGTDPDFTGVDIVEITVNDAGGDSQLASDSNPTLDVAEASEISNRIDIVAQDDGDAIADNTLKAGNLDTGDTVNFVGFDASNASANLQADLASGVTTAGSTLEIGIDADATGSGAVEKVTSNAETVTLDLTSTDNDTTTVKNVTATNATTLNVEGSDDVVLGGDTAINLAASATLDASNLNGSFTYTASETVSTINTSTDGSASTINLGDYADGTTVNGNGAADTVTLNETGSDIAPTLKNVETVTIAPTSDTSGSISTENFENVGEIKIAGAEQSVKLTELANQSSVTVVTSNTGLVDYTQETVHLNVASGATDVSAVFSGDGAVGSSSHDATIKTNATKLTIDDQIDASDLTFDQNVTLEGDTNTITDLVLKGGGDKSSNTAATMLIDGTSNVDLEDVDATDLDSDLDLVGVDTSGGATIDMNSDSAQKLTIDKADAVADAIDISGGSSNSDEVAVAGIGANSGILDVKVDSVGVENLTVQFIDDGSSQDDSSINMVEADGVDTLNVAVAAQSSDNGDAARFDAQLDITNVAKDSTVTFGSTDPDGAEFGNASSKDVNLNLASTGTVTVSNTSALTFLDANSSNGLVVGDKVQALNIHQGANNALDIQDFDANAALTSLSVGTNATQSDGSDLYGSANVTVTDVTAAGLLTLDIDSSNGTVTVGDDEGISADALTTVNIAGDNAVTIGTDTGVETEALTAVNGGDATGNITLGTGLEFSGDASITTGTGDDTIGFDFESAADKIDIAAGDGTDTLKLVSGNADSNNAVIDLSAADQIVSIDGSGDAGSQTGFENVDASGLNDGGAGVNVTAAAGGSEIIGSKNDDVLFGGASGDIFDLTAGGNDTVQGGGGDDTIKGEAADFTAQDSLDGGSGSDDEIEITADNTGTGAVLDDISGIEKITILESGTPTDNVKVTLQYTNDSTDNITVDASALDDGGADFTFDASDANAKGDYNITGGAGDDVITGGAGDDTIDGGAGADNIIGGAGADQIDVSSGDNFIQYSAKTDGSAAGSAGGTFSGNDVITNFDAASGDVLVFDSGDKTNGAVTDTAFIDNVQVVDHDAATTEGADLDGGGSEQTDVDAVVAFLEDIGIGTSGQTDLFAVKFDTSTAVYIADSDADSTGADITAADVTFLATIDTSTDIDAADFDIADS